MKLLLACLAVRDFATRVFRNTKPSYNKLRNAGPKKLYSHTTPYRPDLFSQGSTHPCLKPTQTALSYDNPPPPLLYPITCCTTLDAMTAPPNPDLHSRISMRVNGLRKGEASKKSGYVGEKTPITHGAGFFFFQPRFTYHGTDRFL